MKHSLFVPSPAYYPAFDNDALIPELWAQEALLILENNVVATNLVHRDFEDEIAAFGDVVNAHRPQERTPRRKTDNDAVSTTTTDSDNVAVPLNQHIYDSFIIKDGEESKSFRSLVELHLAPAMIGIAQMVDEIVATGVYQFLRAGNSVGRLGQGVTKQTLIDARDKMNQLRVPAGDRSILLTSPQEADLLDTDLFTSAEKVGDDGTALREGSLGRKFGFNVFMDQNMPSIPVGNTIAVGAINNAGGYPAGTTVMTVDGFSAAIAAGSYLTVAGDDTPLRVVSTVGGGTPTQITVDRPLLRAVADNAVVTSYTPGQVNNAGGYAAGWLKDIVVDTFTVAPKKGQLVSFGDGSTVNDFGIIGAPTTTAILTDRPLVAAIADNDGVNIGPAGEYGMAFSRNAYALVTRPLAQPDPRSGAWSFVASHNGLSIRVVIQYDSKEQGHRVNLDLLCGVALLDDRLAIPFLG